MKSKISISNNEPIIVSFALGCFMYPIAISTWRLFRKYIVKKIRKIDFDTAGGKDRCLRKAEAVLQNRTENIIMVLERCRNTHNYTAILRSAECLGIQNIWVIDAYDNVIEFTENDQPKQGKKQWSEDHKLEQTHKAYARESAKWITVKRFASTKECIKALRAQNFEIWATDLSQEAEIMDTDGPDIPKKLAIVMGTEASGVSDLIIEASDRRVYYPTYGYSDSLNVSVAAALVLQHVFFLCPSARGNISQQTKQKLRKDWYSQLARDEKALKEYALRVNDPPKPYDDLRRPDEHRIAWVTNKQKKKDIELK